MRETPNLDEYMQMVGHIEGCSKHITTTDCNCGHDDAVESVAALRADLARLRDENAELQASFNEASEDVRRLVHTNSRLRARAELADEMAVWMRAWEPCDRGDEGDKWLAHYDEISKSEPEELPQPKETEMLEPLTFDLFREINAQRNERWAATGSGRRWTLSDWCVELGGEVGEALNVVKKLNRDADGMTGNRGVSRTELLEQLRDELGDVAICLDLLAHAAGIDLGEAVALKFNKTSEKVGFPERLPVTRRSFPGDFVVRP